MHSDDAITIFGPGAFEVSASRSVSRILPTEYVWSMRLTHFAPTPRTASSIGWLVSRDLLLAREDGMSCPPVAAE